MIKIIADKSLPLQGLFPKPFEITVYSDRAELSALLLQQHDVLLCRSMLKVNASLLQGSSITCVATASSGVDHLDLDYLHDQRIQWVDAKGSNAQAVTEYVLSCLALVQHQHHIKQLGQVGIIGYGAVGSLLTRRLLELGIEVWVYDPLLSRTDHAVRWVDELQQLCHCEVICVHANLHHDLPYPSHDLINLMFLQQLSRNTIVINASRGSIVNEDALLQVQQPLIYCTDVYQEEPDISAQVVDKAFICTPHIAGHAIEAKRAAVALLSRKLQQRFWKVAPNNAHDTKKVEIPALSAKNWQQYALSCYNPQHETQALKAAFDKSAAFQHLRAQHKRHHFE